MCVVEQAKEYVWKELVIRELLAVSFKEQFFFFFTLFTDVCRNHTCKQEHTIDAGNSRSTHTCPLSFTETAARGGWTQREVDAVSPRDQCQIEFRPGGLLGLVTRWFTSLSVPCFTGKGSTALTGKNTLSQSVDKCLLQTDKAVMGSYNYA
jgi:hypothetical protein